MTTALLDDLRRRGVRAVELPTTPDGEGLYRSLGSTESAGPWRQHSRTTDHGHVADLQDRLVEAVHRAVGTRPRGSAVVDDAADDGRAMRFVTVTTRAPGAADVGLALTPDEATLSFGSTHTYLWIDEQTPALVEALVEAVLAGRFVERGPRADAFAEVTLADGERWSGGAATARFWPGRRRRYAPCT